MYSPDQQICTFICLYFDPLCVNIYYNYCYKLVPRSRQLCYIRVNTINKYVL